MTLSFRRSLAPAAGAVITLVSACESQKAKYEGPYAAEVAEAVPMIEKSIGLKFKTPPKVETRTKEKVRALGTKQFTDALPNHDIACQEAAYKLFSIIPDTLNPQQFLAS